TLWHDKLAAGHRFMNSENLDNEKSHFSISLMPTSPRMQYGLDLSNALLRKMEKTMQKQGGALATFYIVTPNGPETQAEQMYLFKEKYYRSSGRQFVAHMKMWNKDLRFFPIAIDNHKWQVHQQDYIHLNEHATDEAMSLLAAKIDTLIPEHNNLLTAH
ncbi:MAG: hypothetical protein AAFO94_22640, partial [Bacteroidota bacterium]